MAETEGVSPPAPSSDTNVVEGPTEGFREGSGGVEVLARGERRLTCREVRSGKLGRGGRQDRRRESEERKKREPHSGRRMRMRMDCRS
jgi:hypothetical protein